MKKRLLSLLLVICMVTTMLPLQVFAANAAENNVTIVQSNDSKEIINPFIDVNEDAWYYDSVMYALQNELFDGVSDKEFDPNGTMTRAMYVTVLGRMAEIDTAKYSGDTGFTDIDRIHWAAPYVLWAKEMGITVGVDDERFGTNDLITREQMAALTVRFFEKNGISFPETVNTTVPNDLDSIAPYAKEAVLKLWSCGLFKGDENGNFNPSKSATRAETAAFCARADERVEQWLVETGVKEAPGEGNPEKVPDKKPGSPSDPSGDGGTYTVTFNISNTITENRSYKKGMLISEMPIPYQPQKLFLSWYYDSAFTKMVESKDTLQGNLQLYAKFADSQLSEAGSPNFLSAEDQRKDFSVRIAGAVDGKAIEESDYKLYDLTNPSLTNGAADVTQESLSYSEGTLSVVNGFTEGHTYQIELLDDEVVFVVNGEKQDAAIRYYNFNISKEDVMTLSVSDGIYYINADNKNDALSDEDANKILGKSGLVQMSLSDSGDTTYKEVENSGSFTFTAGELHVGDIVSVYKGTRPDQRDLQSDNSGDAIYIEIDSADGTTYSYKAAKSTEVLSLPDVLPVKATDVAVSPATVANSKLDFSGYSQMGYDRDTKVEKGDYLALYSGEILGEGSTVVYKRVTNVVVDGENTTITYEDSNEEDVFKSVELYQERALTTEELNTGMKDKQLMEQQLLAQIEESGFGEDVGRYLAEMTLQTDEVKEYFGEQLGLEDVSITYAENGVSSDTLQPMGTLVGIGGDGKPELKVNMTTTLSHYEDKTGVRSEIIMSYEFEIRKKDSKKQLNVELEAFFEQETLFDLTVNGEATWKKFCRIPYLAEYRIGGGLDLGNYTGVGITATATLADAEEEWGMPWPENAAQAQTTRKIVSLTESINKLMETKDTLTAGDDVSAEGGLSDKYADFLEDANDAWIDIFEVEIFSTDIPLDPSHICVIGIETEFVVSANLNVALGFTMTYENAKRHTFNVSLFAMKANFNSVDLVKENYRFDCYVMGTMGIRAGVRVTVSIALVSTSLAKAGISLEAGAYAQLWGYFYYSYQWEKGAGDESSYSGALYSELGAYLTIGFAADALNGVLSYECDITDIKVPLINVGWRENVYDFAYGQEATPECNFVGSAKFTLPDEIFNMKYMDMTTGEELEGIFDTEYNIFDWIADKIKGEPTGDKADDEKYFIIELSNPLFSYNPKKNQITIDATQTGELTQSCEMKLLWVRSPLTFSSQALSRTITINWSNPGSYVSFDSLGGEIYDPIVKVAGTNIEAFAPEDPTRDGYTFKGWCKNTADGHTHDNYEACTIIRVPATMPETPLALSACWEPKAAEYTVEHYFENLDGTYTLDATKTETRSGESRKVIQVAASVYDGFTVKQPSRTIEILPNGSAVAKFYYARNLYKATFANIDNAGGESVYKLVYGAEITAPIPRVTGYTMTGWDEAIPTTMPAENKTFTAQWEINHYTVTLDANGGNFEGQESKTKMYDYGSTYGELTAPTAPENMQFAGWWTEKDGGKPIKADSRLSPMKDHTIYAHWAELSEIPYTVKHLFKQKDGSFAEDEALRETLYAEVGNETAAQAKEKPGYTAQEITNVTVAAGAPIVIEVKYNLIEYTITLGKKAYHVFEFTEEEQELLNACKTYTVLDEVELPLLNLIKEITVEGTLKKMYIASWQVNDYYDRGAKYTKIPVGTTGNLQLNADFQDIVVYAEMLGQTITMENHKNQITAGSGTVSFDIKSNTLILNNATIDSSFVERKTTSSDKKYNTGIYIEDDLGKFNILLIGKNTININSNSEGGCSGIVGGYGTMLTITGDGSLNICNKQEKDFKGIYLSGGLTLESNLSVESLQAADKQYGISVRSFVMNGGTFTINKADGQEYFAGIDCYNSFSMTGGTIDLKGKYVKGIGISTLGNSFEMSGGTINIIGDYETGIFVEEKFTMSDGTINIKAVNSTQVNCTGIRLDCDTGASITGGTIDVSAKGTIRSYGIETYSRNLAISGEGTSVNILAHDALQTGFLNAGGDSLGIYFHIKEDSQTDGISISDGAEVTITSSNAKNDSYGIFASGSNQLNVTIDSATLIAISGNAKNSNAFYKTGLSIANVDAVTGETEEGAEAYPAINKDIGKYFKTTRKMISQ